MATSIGTVQSLWRYPVKSMGGERCESLELDKRGAAGDRAYAVRDADGKLGSGKNTRRFRQIDGLLGFRAAYVGKHAEVTFPDGTRVRIDDPAIDAALTQALGQPVRVAPEIDVMHFDAAPLHVLSTAALRWLCGCLPHARIDERRFRPNLLLDVPGDFPPEQAWLGTTFRIGADVTLRIVDGTERCGMVALAQNDLPQDPQVLRHITQEADLLFGVYADVVTPGTVRCGDAVVRLG